MLGVKSTYVPYFLDYILGLEYFPLSVISKTFWDIKKNKNPNNLFSSLENIPGPYHWHGISWKSECILVKCYADTLDIIISEPWIHHRSLAIDTACWKSERILGKCYAESYDIMLDIMHPVKECIMRRVWFLKCQVTLPLHLHHTPSVVTGFNAEHCMHPWTFLCQKSYQNSNFVLSIHCIQ